MFTLWDGGGFPLTIPNIIVQEGREAAERAELQLKSKSLILVKTEIIPIVPLPPGLKSV